MTRAYFTGQRGLTRRVGATSTTTNLSSMYSAQMRLFANDNKKDDDKTGALNAEETEAPVKKKRGRPKKVKLEEEQATSKS